MSNTGLTQPQKHQSGASLRSLGGVGGIPFALLKGCGMASRTKLSPLPVSPSMNTWAHLFQHYGNDPRVAPTPGVLVYRGALDAQLINSMSMVSVV